MVIRVTKISHPIGPQDTSPIRANISSADKMKCSASKPRISSAHNVLHPSCHTPPRPEICFRITRKHPLGCKYETFAIPVLQLAQKQLLPCSPRQPLGPTSATRNRHPSRSRPRAYPHPFEQVSHGPTRCNLLSQITSRRPRGLNWISL